MRKKVFSSASLVFSLIGIFFIVFFGLVGFSYLDTYRHRVKVEGVVSEIDLSERTTYVRYTASEATIEVPFTIIDSEFKEGTKVVVYYNESDPTDAFLKEEIVSIFYFFVVGIGLLLVGLIFYFKKLYKRIEAEHLKNHGKLIKTKISKIEINDTAPFTKSKPYRLICEYEEMGKRYRFINHEIWFDIEKIVKKKKIKTIDVYVNKNNYKKYYMDLSKLK